MAKTARTSKKEEQKTGFKEQFSALRNLPLFFQLIWRASKKMTLLNVSLRLLKALLPVSMLYVGKLIIDEIVLLIEQGEATPRYLWTLIAIELALALSSELLNRVITLVDSLLGDLFSNTTSTAIIRHAATLDLYQFEDADFYDKLDRARRQTTGRTVLMSQVLTQLQSIITVISLGVGLVAYNPWLLLILFVAIIPSFLGESHFNQRSYSLTRSWTPERRELDYLRYIGTSDRTAKEVKVFGLSDFLADRFEGLADQYYHANKKIAVNRALVGSGLSAIGTVAYYGAYIFIILQTIEGIITLGTLTFLAGSFQRMSGNLQSIMNRFSKIADNALYLQDLFDFFDIQADIISSEDALLVSQPIREGFTFENVSFRYPNSRRWAIRNLSFHLPKGEKLALVGENGAGKTTLVKLLARLYEPTEGRILLDGVDLKHYDLDDLRLNIGIIFQDYYRYHLKASENIAIGSISERKNDELIRRAALKSLANTVIEELPAQYEQVLGKRFEKGLDLSGGQWQKIALARAYMRNAQLLILDEPTAALDARSEHEVFLRFTELIADKSAVLISHRFSTVRMADRILFLEHGQKLECGTHEELIEEQGKYAELFNLQAQAYQ
ncbi:MAG: ABC transporter ATP-binding protein [Bacteroidota bacterium]